MNQDATHLRRTSAFRGGARVAATAKQKTTMKTDPAPQPSAPETATPIKSPPRWDTPMSQTNEVYSMIYTPFGDYVLHADYERTATALASAQEELKKVSEVRARYVMSHIERICGECGHDKDEDGKCANCISSQIDSLRELLEQCPLLFTTTCNLSEKAWIEKAKKTLNNGQSEIAFRHFAAESVKTDTPESDKEAWFDNDEGWWVSRSVARRLERGRDCYNKQLRIVESDLSQAQERIRQLEEAERKRAAGWTAFYEAELERTAKNEAQCKSENDTHGMNFYQGQRSGFISTDIWMCQFKPSDPIPAAAETVHISREITPLAVSPTQPYTHKTVDTYATFPAAAEPIIEAGFEVPAFAPPKDSIKYVWWSWHPNYPYWLKSCWSGKTIEEAKQKITHGQLDYYHNKLIREGDGAFTEVLDQPCERLDIWERIRLQKELVAEAEPKEEA